MDNKINELKEKIQHLRTNRLRRWPIDLKEEVVRLAEELGDRNEITKLCNLLTLAPSTVFSWQKKLNEDPITDTKILEVSQPNGVTLDLVLHDLGLTIKVQRHASR